MNYHKNGNIGGAVGSIVALIVGVGVSVMVLIFVGVLGGQTYQMQEAAINTISKTNITGETVGTPIIGVATALAKHPIWTGSLVLKNGTQIIAASNYTVDAAAGKFTLKALSLWNATATPTATYLYGTEGIQTGIKGSILSGFGALQQTGDYLPIIVLAVVITMVMALVLSMQIGQGSSGNAL